MELDVGWVGGVVGNGKGDWMQFMSKKLQLEFVHITATPSVQGVFSVTPPRNLTSSQIQVQASKNVQISFQIRNMPAI